MTAICILLACLAVALYAIAILMRDNQDLRAGSRANLLRALVAEQTLEAVRHSAVPVIDLALWEYEMEDQA